MRYLWFLGFVAVTVLPAWGEENCRPDKEAKSLQGEWVVVGLEDEGQRASAEEVKGMKWVIRGTTITGTNPDGSTGSMRFALNPKSQPKEIDLTSLDGNLKGVVHIGIYELQKGRLRICVGDRKPNATRKGRPKEFAAPPNSGFGMILLEKKAQ